MTHACQHPAATATLALTFLLGACAGPARTGEGIVGRTWSEQAGAFVDTARVVDAAANADFVLLGETHDIEAHHLGQARLIRAVAAHRTAAVVLEMVRRDQQPAIDRWRREDGDPDSFGAAVNWEASGWPDWSMYRPIVEAAIALDLPILAAAPPAALLREVGHNGLGTLDPSRRQELGLDRPLPNPGRSRLEATLRGAHCGVDDDDMVAAMLAVQRLRDAYFAETMRAAAGEHGAAILVAGRGHTRADHGVPLYLPGQAGNMPIVSIAFAGVGEFGTVESLRESGGGAIAHDYAWFTEGGRPVPGCDAE